MTTQHEVEQRVAGRGAIGAYLGQIFGDFDHTGARMKPLWDLGPIARLVQPAWCPSILMRSPVLHDDLSWGDEPSRHLIREIRDVNADASCTTSLPSCRQAEPELVIFDGAADLASVSE
jgi:purine nucleosidase